MSRTVEKVLSIISIVFNVLSLGLLILFIFAGKMLMSDPFLKEEMEREFVGSGLTQAEIDASIEMTRTILTFITSIGWLLIILVIVAIVLAIIGVVKVNKDAKTAGILFFISSILSGLMSLAGILLIVAGIMCFVRKEVQPPIIEQSTHIED